MLQFRLRTLFIVTTSVALLAWILFVPPEWVGLLVLNVGYVLLPTATVAGIIYHHGYRRAFFVGMATWLTIAWLIVFLEHGIEGFLPAFLWRSSPWDQFEIKLILLIVLALAVASGFVSVAMRWWALSAQGRDDETA